MRLVVSLALLLSTCLAQAAASPTNKQSVLQPAAPRVGLKYYPQHTFQPKQFDELYWSKEEGVGHFSEWSKAQKRNFVDDVRAGKAGDWILVM